MTILAQLADNTESWVGIENSESKKDAQTVLSILDYLQGICYTERKWNEDEQSNGPEPEIEEEGILGDDFISEYLKVYFNNEDTINKENQRLLRNLNLHEIVMNIVEYRIHKFEWDETYMQVLKKCYNFLIRFVR